MTTAAMLREHLLDKLAPIFGEPQNADGLADALAERCGSHVTAERLGELADRIIETRKLKGFPSAADLIAAVKGIPAPAGTGITGRKFETQAERNERSKAQDLAEKRAIQLLRGTDLAKRAVAELWAPGLIEFAAKHGRAPQADEEGPIIRLSHENNDGARKLQQEAKPEFVKVARGIAVLRVDMHDRAARDLGFGKPRPPTTNVPPSRHTHEPTIPPIDPETLKPTDELIDLLGG